MCHEDLIRWWTREEARSHQICLFPRDHQKSVLVALRVAFEITRNPAVTIMYLSSTASLAEKQLKFIKNILDSKVYRRYWPEMIDPQEGKREKWANDSIIVDHPIRKREAPGDPTVFVGGLTTSMTGFHCDISVLDDVVVQENAYTAEGRRKVASQYSLLASIETTDARQWVVGTRYHPQDLYGEMLEMEAEIFDEEGNLVSSEPVYELIERKVEDIGDGTGEYLWPRVQRSDGRWFGFNQSVLARKRAQYLDKAQFRAQYYNDPNSSDDEAISRDSFQYYDKAQLEQSNGVWLYKGKPLNTFAAIDFAFSTKLRADYTALVVIGMDEDGYYYILEIKRFKTNKISDYYKAVFDTQEHWNYRRLRAEVTVAQEAVVAELETRIRESALSLSIEKVRPNKHQGTKEERMEAILNPRYENHSVYHYRGGLCQELEEELTQRRPAHDDMKDGLSNAMEMAKPPRKQRNKKVTKIETHPRFGGVSL